MTKISAVYQIINTVTGDRYVGSSKDVMRRWREHKEPSKWNQNPNSLMYQDMQKYGLDKFRFQILAPVMEEYLKQVEQEFIDMLKPMYNNYRAKGFDVERFRGYMKEYNQSERRKESYRRCHQSNKEHYKELNRTYLSQLCSYNEEVVTLDTLRCRFRRAGIKHPTAEARKYLINGENKC